jgi:hypothetical protein
LGQGIGFNVLALENHSDEPDTTAIVELNLRRLADGMARLEEPLLNTASDGSLEPDVLSCVGERWSRLDIMTEQYHERITDLRALPKWYDCHDIDSVLYLQIPIGRMLSVKFKMSCEPRMLLCHQIEWNRP